MTRTQLTCALSLYAVLLAGQLVLNACTVIAVEPAAHPAGIPPGQQPPPGNCSELKYRMPPGVILVHG